MPIHYVTGDATAPTGVGPKIIVHVCNDIGGWGRGFVMVVSKRWAGPENAYRAWHKGEIQDMPFELGQVQFVQVENELWVANLIGQRDIRKKNGVPPVRYDAIRAGLARVAAKAAELRASVHMPRIGCGLAGGCWEEIERILTDELGSVDVTVYDLPA